MAQTLQHAKPCMLLWADTGVEGGAGPPQIATVPNGCQLFQIHAFAQDLPNAPHNPSLTASADSHMFCSTALRKQLKELFGHWQSVFDSRTQLPFSYVMYTSGSTGQPVGVCGTESGQSLK